MQVKRWLKDVSAQFSEMIFPNCCVACQNSLLKAEQFICTECRANLPKTNYHLHDSQNNPISQKFWGKVDVKHSLAYLHFKKDGKVQKILHHIKYKNQPELAKMLGRWYAEDLQQGNLHNAFDAVVAIPLHPARLQQRGYNQSEMFAEGLCEVLQLEHLSLFFKRIKQTQTQTNKDKLERWQNVANIFETTEQNIFKNKKVLLVDDVTTTGSTMESGVKCLKNCVGLQISVASVANA